MCVPKFPFFKCNTVESRLLNDSPRIPRHIAIHRPSKTRSINYLTNEFRNRHARYSYAVEDAATGACAGAGVGIETILLW
jgi:hypothetical protein